MKGQAPSAQREMHPDALEIMQDLNKESKRIARYRARMESVDKWMGKRHLPKSLRARIGHHYQEVYSHMSCNASSTPQSRGPFLIITSLKLYPRPMLPAMSLSAHIGHAYTG